MTNVISQPIFHQHSVGGKGIVKHRCLEGGTHRSALQIQSHFWLLTSTRPPVHFRLVWDVVFALSSQRQTNSTNIENLVSEYITYTRSYPTTGVITVINGSCRDIKNTI